MSDISIGIGVRDNASGVIPGISRAIEELAASSEKLQKATDWNAVGNQVGVLTKYREELEKVSRVQKEMEATKRSGGGGGGPFGANQGFFNTPGNIVNAIGGMGRDAGAGVAGGITTVGQGLKGLEGLGGLFGAVGMVIVGLGLLAKAVNAVAKQYEEQVPALMEYNALLGAVTKKDALVGSMNRISAISAEYGYDLQTGLGVGGALLRGGGRESSVGTVLSFMRGMGLDQGLGVQAETYRSRFGVAGLSGLLGGFNQTGMAAGRFGEYSQTAMSAFEAAMSRGVIRGMTDKGGILETINWMASTNNELFRGAQGQRLYQQMDTSIAGATALSSQKDAIMYRAARDVMGGRGGFLETQMELEKGLSPQMFNSIRKQIMAYAGSDVTTQTMLMRNAFGVSFTMAKQLLELPETTAYEKLSAAAPSYTGTPEMEGLRLQQQIANNVRNIGALLYEWRLKMLRAGEWATGAGGELLTWIKGLEGYSTGPVPTGSKSEAEITGSITGAQTSLYNMLDVYQGQSRGMDDPLNDVLWGGRTLLTTMPKAIKEKVGWSKVLEAQRQGYEAGDDFRPLINSLVELAAQMKNAAKELNIEINWEAYNAVVNNTSTLDHRAMGQ